jgi:hypothetical protein
MSDREDSGDVKKSWEEEQYEKLMKDFNAWLKDHYEKVLNGED